MKLTPKGCTSTNYIVMSIILDYILMQIITVYVRKIVPQTGVIYLIINNNTVLRYSPTTCRDEIIR